MPRAFPLSLRNNCNVILQRGRSHDQTRSDRWHGVGVAAKHRSFAAAIKAGGGGGGQRERHGPGGRAAVTDPAPLRCAPAGGCAAPSRGRATSLRLGVRGRDAAARTMSWLSGSRGVVLTAYHPSGGTGG